MQFGGAIFDMDGLLFDTERMYQQTWHEIAAEYGIELAEGFLKDISGTIGARMCRVIEHYYRVPDGNVIIEECMGRMQEKLSVHVPVKDGVPEILRFFQEKGIPMAVASSSYEKQIEANLKKADIYKYFTAIISGTEVEHGKPAPDIFLYAAGRIGCKPRECFVFEDSENGIRAGYAAGCMTIMIPDMMQPTPEIIPCCRRIYPSLKDAWKGIASELD